MAWPRAGVDGTPGGADALALEVAEVEAAEAAHRSDGGSYAIGPGAVPDLVQEGRLREDIAFDGSQPEAKVLVAQSGTSLVYTVALRDAWARTECVRLAVAAAKVGLRAWCDVVLDPADRDGQVVLARFAPLPSPRVPGR